MGQEADPGQTHRLPLALEQLNNKYCPSKGHLGHSFRGHAASGHWLLGILVSAFTDVHLIEAIGAEVEAGDLG